MLKINADFNTRVVINAADQPWVASPVPCIERIMLDRVGDEVARATSLVRYAPDARFTSHTHGGGEEILVLQGEFHDEHGSYPAGTYLRNPIGSSHAPWAGTDGTLLFVKLHQFQSDDKRQFHMDTRTQTWHPGLVEGLQVMPLHSHNTENVSLVRWAPNTRFSPHRHWGGEEILVLEGVFRDEHGEYPAGTWIRSPHLSQHQPWTGAEGALIYVKTGHL